MTTELEVSELKHRIETVYGKSLSTTTDFDEFSLVLKRKHNAEVSSSTMKRMWGYVNDKHVPRTATLNILATYVGCKDYADFISQLKKEESRNSSFFHCEQITSASLSVGDMIEIGWSPNRILHLLYCGDSIYEVSEAVNSKLAIGDRFVAGCFIMSQPLYLPYVERKGEHLPAFVAGRNTGLSILRRIS